MIINASAHQIPLADKSVHACVTSPPYFGLRKYAGAQDVAWPSGVYAPMTGCPPCVEVPAMACPLGNEPTIEAFCWHLLLVMREVRRVLRDDGVAWVNLGDSFSADRGYQVPDSKHRDVGNSMAMKMSDQIANGNLLAIPHRFALAAQADGWILRNDCVWHKKSAMPESVSGWKWVRCQTKVKDASRGKESFCRGAYGDNPQRDHAPDGSFAKSETIACSGCEVCAETGGYVLRRGSWRMTRAHEYVFQFVKQMGYWSDSEIVKEALAQPDAADGSRIFGGVNKSGSNLQHSRTEGRAYDSLPSGRNPRSVFSPSPSPYKDAHYATFPANLIRPLILSSIPRHCCPECGQGWAAVVDYKRAISKDCPKYEGAHLARGGHGRPSGTVGQSGSGRIDGYSITTGYRPTCQCDREDYKPGIVLDPFVGSGTTLEVARECGVKAIGLDISHEYLDEQASWRGLQIAKPKFEDMPLFAEVSA